MSWEHVNETLTERIHLAKGQLSGIQNSSKAVFAGTSCSPSQAAISLPSQDSSPNKGLQEETEKARPKVLQTDRPDSGRPTSPAQSRRVTPRMVTLDLCYSCRRNTKMQWGFSLNITFNPP